MKKNVVRVLALVLVALMCLSLVPLAAHAEAHVHEMAEDHQDPTCVDNGFNQTYCPICGATFSMEYIPATGVHSFMNVVDEQYLILEGDCEHAFQYWKSCSVCQQSAEEAYAKALDELYEDLNNRKNSGEQADWEQIVKDRVLLLDEKYKFSYGGEGHHYIHVDHQEATCTSDGWKEYSYCDVCGEYFNYEVIPAKGHRWGEYTQTKAPTCTEAGEKVRVCEVCDEKDVVVLPALGHAWGEFKVTKEATCTEDGSRERVCSVCNEKEVQVIPAAHKFGEYVVTLEPTCFVDGSRERTCTVCGHKEVEAIPAAHTYGEFTVTQEPTCYSTGAKTAKCTVCGEEHTEWIDMVPHKYENGECVFCHAAMPEGYVAPSEDRTEITETAGSETETTDNQTTETETTDNQTTETETTDNQTTETQTTDNQTTETQTTAPEQQGAEPAAEAAPVNTVTITFDGNGATGGSMEPQAFAEGSVQALSANAFTRDGYLFLGWDVAADGSAMGEDRFLDGEAVEVNSDVTLYAQWREINADVETQQTEASAETVSSFENVLNAQGLTELDPSAMVVQNVTPLNENGERMSNEEVAARGGVIFDMPLPDTYEEGHEIEVYHQNSETGEWERVTTYTVQGDKVVVCLKHFSPVVTLDRTALGGMLKAGNTPMLGAGGIPALEGVKLTGASRPDVRSAFVGDTLKIDPNVISEADKNKYTYQWYRTNSNDVDFKIPASEGGVDFTYTVKEKDLDYSISCAVIEQQGDETASERTDGLLVRKNVRFAVEIKGIGTVRMTDIDAVEPTVRIEKTENVNTQETLQIDTITGNDFTIVMEPYRIDPSNLYYLKSYTATNNAFGGNDTTVREAPKTVNFTISASANGQKVTIFFDRPDIYTNANGEGITQEDITDHQNALSHKDPNSVDALDTLRQVLADQYSLEKDDIKTNGVIYVTPKWVHESEFMTSQQIKDIGGVSFELDYPAGVTRTSHVIQVYHYKNGWGSPLDSKYVDLGTKKITIKNYDQFSPFAVLALPSVALSFDGNGGEGTMTAMTAVQGSIIEAPKCEYTYAGKVFVGWNTEKNPTETNPGTAYDVGDPITMDGNITLNAQWENSVTISFYPGEGGEGEMTPQIEPIGTEITLKKNEFTRENHEFVGWVDQDGKGYADQGTLATAKNLTLTAQWERKQYTISYNGNGGGGKMEDRTVSKNGSVTLDACTFTVPAGKMFGGWNTEADPTTENPGTYYEDKATFKPKDDMTLYAVWRDKILVSFYPNGSGGATDSYKEQYVPKDTPTALEKNTYTAPSGQVFAGWNTAYDGTGEHYSDGEKVKISAPLPLYAQWSTPIKLSYDPNGGSLKTSAGEFTTARTWTIPKDTEITLYTSDELKLTRSGYEFKGWALSSSAKEPRHYEEDSTRDWTKENEPIIVKEGFGRDTTIYAVWEQKEFLGVLTIKGGISGSSDIGYMGEELKAEISGDKHFEVDHYQWYRDGVAIDGATEQTYRPTSLQDDFESIFTCDVYLKNAEGNPYHSRNSKYIYADTSEKNIVNNGQTEIDYVEGLYDGMYVVTPSGKKEKITLTTSGYPVTESGTYRFYVDATSTTPVATVDVVNWWTIGYNVSSGSSSDGGGTVTMKRGSTTMTSSTTIKDNTTGEVLLKPYSGLSGYSNVWAVRDGAGINDITLTVRPSSGSYGHVSRNGSGYSSSNAERIISIGTIKEPEMYDIIFNKSSSSPRTGDMSNLGLWSALCLVSFVGVTTILTSARKRKKRG